MEDVKSITINNNTQGIADYLAQLLKDKKQLGAFPTVFIHLERLLDEEIAKVRASLFQINGKIKEPLILPDADGAVMTRTEKVFVPVKDHPDYNFVGRILGPRGMTAKQLEQETGCKIMVRGKGSMRDKKKEEQNRGKQNWEHLSEELHVLITVDDTPNRATVKLQRATEEIQKLLIPVTEGEDELKKRQLMELAIINGTYRDSNAKLAGTELMKGDDKQYMMYSSELLQRMTHFTGNEAPRLIGPHTGIQFSTQLRGPHNNNPMGAPLILSPRLQMNASTAAAILNGGGPPPLISPADGLLYSPYDYHQYAALTSPLMAEYTQAAEHAGALFGR